ncbi:MAG: polyprenyl synthetase family protein [Bacillota bacterium]|nr:polyprenyl synthetase family protein [Bacillota bacterium]
MDFNKKLGEYSEIINNALDMYLPETGCKQNEILKSMRYSLLAGGKRLRPALLLEFCRISGGNTEAALPFACALEMIHTYSLIHDDLPCMDNDDLRRGMQTNHKVFGEGMAVLSGDGLLNFAFEIMLDPEKSELPCGLLMRAAFEIACASGVFGMIGGQVIDLSFENGSPELSEITHMDSLKTGALISAACKAGCILAEAPKAYLEAASKYAAALGLAFQIKDDMLDVTGCEREIGKPVGSDKSRNIPTYMSLLGGQECARLVDELTKKAVAAVIDLPDSEFLCALAEAMAGRGK